MVSVGGGDYKYRFFILPSIPQPLSPKEGERGAFGDFWTSGLLDFWTRGLPVSLLPPWATVYTPSLPSPDAGCGVGGEGNRGVCRTFSASDEKHPLVRVTRRLGSQLPQPDGIIVATTDELFAVGADGQGKY